MRKKRILLTYFFVSCYQEYKAIPTSPDPVYTAVLLSSRLLVCEVTDPVTLSS